MKNTLSQILRINPVFSNLNAGTIDEIVELAIMKEYNTDEVLTFAGDIWPYLFLIYKGHISVFKESSEGRGLSIAEFGQGDLFWGPAFFHEEAPNPVTIKSKQNSIIYLWSRERILPFLLENGSLTWELSRLMLTRMLNASDIITGLAFQQVSERLANFLIKLPGHNKPGPITRSLTLDEIASRIGSTREMVCRFLQSFANQGLIKITRTELEILDWHQLKQMAEKEKP